MVRPVQSGIHRHALVTRNMYVEQNRPVQKYRVLLEWVTRPCLAVLTRLFLRLVF